MAILAASQKIIGNTIRGVSVHSPHNQSLNLTLKEWGRNKFPNWFVILTTKSKDIFG